MATLLLHLPDQRVLFANEGATALIGSPRSAVVGLRPGELWDGVDGSRAELALSTLSAGAVDSYRARHWLRTRRGPVTASVWVRRMLANGVPVAVMIVEPGPDRASGAESIEARLGSEGPGSDGERIAVLEGHLLRFAAELHAGGWSEAQPAAADPSRLAELDQLPKRQRAIVDRLLRGERIPSIAASMYISPSTARNHLSHVFAAFGVHSQS
jgi:DNA-binding CsgD family transcriptional regulator